MPGTSTLKHVGLAGLIVLGAACMGSVNGDGRGPGANNPGGNGSNPGGNGSNPGGNGSNPGGNGSNPGGNGSNPGNVAPPPPMGPTDPGSAVFRRLTRAEYNNTVRDLLGDTSAPAKSFPADAESSKSGYARGGSVSAVDAGRIYEASEKMATDAVAQRLSTLLPCGQAPTAEPAQASCAQQFIEKFGTRALRRPPTPEEVQAYVALYNEQRTTVKNDFPGAIRVVLSAMLMSPGFLYRWETVPQAIKRDGNFLRFNSYEMASRLSYALYASMPDEGLFTAAAANRLETAQQIEEQVRRMLKDPKLKDGLGDFVNQWLDISDLAEQRKNPVFTNYTPAVADAMLAEAKEMFASVMGGDGKLTTLLTAKYGFTDTGLAKIYGATAAGTGLQKTDLNPDQRAGILTQGAFLAAHAKADESFPIARGRTVADRLLCKDLPLPPDDIPDPKEPGPNLSTRERFEEHGRNPCAAACHNIIDPLGFAFENFDATGAWRTMDGGKAVNAAGAVEVDGRMQSFNNAVALAGILSTSTDVADCMAKQFLRFALRRKEVQGDETHIKAAAEALRANNSDLRELLVALTKSKAFTHRAASTGELLP